VADPKISKIANSQKAMPRGSKPGERRGGRQRGTPNKKTALVNAVLCAAAAQPDASPLVFMLAVMRDQNVPMDLRIEMAAAAAPFLHLRPQRASRQMPPAMQLDSAKLSPLDFLLAVMHGPDVPPRQRIRAARLAAPYLHRPPDRTSDELARVIEQMKRQREHASQLPPKL
jgi:hypothetical protein